MIFLFLELEIFLFEFKDLILGGAGDAVDVCRSFQSRATPVSSRARLEWRYGPGLCFPADGWSRIGHAHTLGHQSLSPFPVFCLLLPDRQ